jgi:hypothetical protein
MGKLTNRHFVMLEPVAVTLKIRGSWFAEVLVSPVAVGGDPSTTVALANASEV